jgi:hypothetical protein
MRNRRGFKHGGPFKALLAGFGRWLRITGIGAEFHIGFAQNFFHENNFACIVPLDGVSDELQGISTQKTAQSQPPVVPNEKHRRNDKRERNPHEMEHLIPTIPVTGNVIDEKAAKHISSGRKERLRERGTRTQILFSLGSLCNYPFELAQGTA